MKYTVLCEDDQGACFIRWFLKKRHVERRDIREIIAPPGQGCGEQWVREHYLSELQVIRKTKENFIVCTDADCLTVSGRIKKLDEECAKAGIPGRTVNDTAALIIPKRNIETWIEYLHGIDVKEDTDYAKPKHRADKKRCEKAAQALDEYCRNFNQNPPRMPQLLFPDSLQRACQEAKRISW
jgi:hypothetical protein